MNRLKPHHYHHPQHSLFHISQTILPLHFLSLPIHKQKLFLTSTPLSVSLSLPKPNSNFKHVRVSEIEAPFWSNREEKENIDTSTEFEDLAAEGEVYKKTLRLVECSMFAAVSGLAYFLSNSLAIENYFACFFALPIVISSMRWGITAGRKTMVATTTLLLVLSGPVKALNYLLMHGLVGFTMGSMWRLKANWLISIIMCSFVRAMGLMGYVLISSFLIRENILAVITINIHASLTFILTSMSFYAIPSMTMIYAIFGTLLLLNCGFFVFLLHFLYALFFTRLGMKASLRLPRWLEMAI